MLNKLLDEPFWEKDSIKENLTPALKKILIQYKHSEGDKGGRKESQEFLLIEGLLEELKFMAEKFEGGRYLKHLEERTMKNALSIIENNIPLFKEEMVKKVSDNEWHKWTNVRLDKLGPISRLERYRYIQNNREEGLEKRAFLFNHFNQINDVSLLVESFNKSFRTRKQLVT